MRIVFMGTPTFAVNCLEKILQTKNEVVAVFTQPDKLFGRKKVLKAPEVKLKANSCGLLVRQPVKFDDEEVEFLKKLNPDIIIVVAYGKILPSAVLNIPRFGCVNIHASLLPRHRGASPIQTSIISGDKLTGVSAMFLNEKLDSGKIIEQVETEIGENETSPELFERLSVMGANLICEVLEKFNCGVVEGVAQNENLATYAPVLTKEQGRINFECSAKMVHKLVCGLVPWPSAYCFVKGKMLKVHKSVVANGNFNLKPAEILLSNGRFIVGCKTGAVEFLEVQLEGRKKMDASSFLNGAGLKSGYKLE